MQYKLFTMSKNLLFTLLVVLLSVPFSARSQSVVINAKINGFRHAHDCGTNNAGNDGGIPGNQPDPRFKVWTGLNSNTGTYNQAMSGPGTLCPGTFGADDVPCNIWTPPGGYIPIPAVTGFANTLSIWMNSWEEDASGFPVSYT